MKIAILPLVVTAVLMGFADTALAANENNCLVTDVNFTNDPSAPRKVMYLVCGSGSVYAAYMTSPGNRCPVTDIDTVKIWEALALGARVSGKFVTVWYNSVNNCDGGTVKIMNAIEVKGN
jgi:hypothetical protein